MRRLMTLEQWSAKCFCLRLRHRKRPTRMCVGSQDTPSVQQPYVGPKLSTPLLAHRDFPVLRRHLSGIGQCTIYAQPIHANASGVHADCICRNGVAEIVYHFINFGNNDKGQPGKVRRGPAPALVYP